jgi:hypothetical protein
MSLNNPKEALPMNDPSYLCRETPTLRWWPELVRLASRRIAIPAEQAQDEFATYVRGKATEWLNPSSQENPWSFPPARNPTDELLAEVRKLTRSVTAFLEQGTLAL